MPAHVATSIAAMNLRPGDILIARLGRPARGDAEGAAAVAESERLTVHTVEIAEADVAELLQASAPADVVLLAAEVSTPEGWLSWLRAAAYSDTAIATASAMPGREAANVRGGVVNPRVPAPVAGCVFIRRQAIDLVGGLDVGLATPAGRLVDFSQRCVEVGLAHVLAGGTIVGKGDHPPPMTDLGEDTAKIDSRYPYYHAWAESSRAAPGRLAGSPGSAVPGERLTVTLDASCLEPYITGTQVQALEIIGALWRTRAVDLRVVLPRVLGDYARDALAGMDGLTTLIWDEVDNGTVRTDIVHRTYQVTDARDVRVLQCLGDRLLITQQDLIAYRNPSYFGSFKEWADYQGAARRTLDAADCAIFIAHHGMEQGIAEGLIDRDRAVVVSQGVDHQVLTMSPEPRAPEGGGHLSDRPFLLCLGTDYRHKNRLFALKVVEQMQARHGWQGTLVLAGPEVPVGGSTADEHAYLETRPRLSEAVFRLPRITEAEKTWLMTNAAAVLYPTVHEGFGLVPFEAAQLGVPCLCAPVTALVELLPNEVFTLTPWNAAESADAAIRVVTDPALRTTLVGRVREAASALTWDANANRLLEVYRDAAAAAPRSSPATAPSVLVGDDGLLPAEVQGALADMAARRRARGALFALIRGAHRAMRLAIRARRLMQRPPPAS